MFKNLFQIQITSNYTLTIVPRFFLNLFKREIWLFILNYWQKSLKNLIISKYFCTTVAKRHEFYFSINSEKVFQTERQTAVPLLLYGNNTGRGKPSVWIRQYIPSYMSPRTIQTNFLRILKHIIKFKLLSCFFFYNLWLNRNFTSSPNRTSRITGMKIKTQSIYW